ncbi:serine/arginine repetitive matrix protein 2 [Streptomyces sp. NPDC046371]|uniref:serine/arginine repetitive matrix protein 2 n=1 Tax=Streptomyces sp. NPDC046371 TaxID=3154916 RepID=UPI00340A6A6D
MSGYGGEARWNDEKQSWETVTGPPGPQPSQPAPQPQPLHIQPVQPLPVQPLPVQPQLPPQPPSYHPTVGPGPGPAPGPAPGSFTTVAPGRSRNAVVAGVVVAVLVAGGVGGWLVWGRDGNTKGTAGSPGTSVSAPGDPGRTSDPASGSPSDSPSPSDGSAPMDDVPPPGFHAVEDPEGFVIAVPEDWNRTSSQEGVFYNSPDGKSLVQIFTLAAPDTTPYESLQQTSRTLAGNPGYEEISLERTGEGDTAELVYAYDREEGRRKVVDRAFTGTDGRQHAILVAGPETDWPKQRENLTTALEFFRP